MTPLERARQRENMKTCLTCEDRAEVGGASYCSKDGKLLHPMLLDKRYPARCPYRADGGSTAMKIIKEGDLSRITAAKRFECPECGCIWECSAGEYRRELLSGEAKCVCICPTCRKEVHIDD